MSSGSLQRKLIAEVIGTFALVFCGTGAIVINDQFGGIGHVGVALSFGLVVTAMIYAFGDISGAHINPAVSLAFAFSGRFPWKQVAPYTAAQISGALVASLLLYLLFPGHHSYGATIPAGPAWQSFVLEIILSALLMLVIMNVSTGSREVGTMAGMAIGFTVLLEALFAGPVCGASMNPARSIGPAVLSGEMGMLWLYILAPCIGTGLGVLGCRAVKGKSCCDPAQPMA